VNILRNHKELSPNEITKNSLDSPPTQIFIKGKIGFSFKMIKLFSRSPKGGKPFPKEIFRNNEKYSPLNM
jgi:hypothetical protein